MGVDAAVFAGGDGKEQAGVEAVVWTLRTVCEALELDFDAITAWYPLNFRGFTESGA